MGAVSGASRIATIVQRRTRAPRRSSIAAKMSTSRVSGIATPRPARGWLSIRAASYSYAAAYGQQGSFRVCFRWFVFQGGRFLMRVCLGLFLGLVVHKSGILLVRRGLWTTGLIPRELPMDRIPGWPLPHAGATRSATADGALL